jgi:hypothetical protein
LIIAAGYIECRQVYGISFRDTEERALEFQFLNFVGII